MQVWTHTNQSAPVLRCLWLLVCLSLTRRSFLRLGKACAFKRRIGQRFCTNMHSGLMLMMDLANLQPLVHLVLFNEWIRGIFFSFQLCSRVHGEELARIRLLLCCWMNIALQQLHMFTRRPTLLPLLLLPLYVRVIPVRWSSAFVAINDLFALKICKFLEVFGVSKSRLTSWSDRLSLSRCKFDWVF
jgi:hypothetical protein